MTMKKLLVIALFLLHHKCIACFTNNVCTSYTGYIFSFLGPFAGCHHDPDVFSTTIEILERHTEKYETHRVTTEDGYILTLFRIPKANPKGVIILQHPVTSDSIIWIGQSNQSFAFLLSDEGYDVWLPNNRGTFYSMQHKTMSSDDFKFWDFSFHEIGIYDYSAIIKYVQKITARNDLVFIGHSMSTTASFIYSSLKPDEAKSAIKLFIEMSPVASTTNVRTPARFLAPIEPFLRAVCHFLQIGRSIEYYSVISLIYKILVFYPFKIFMVWTIAFASGWTPEEFDVELINLLASLNPRGAALKIGYHYAQIVNAGGRFQMFDYGPENLERYKSVAPPEYPIADISVPIYLITSTHDSCATVQDAQDLYEKLRPEVKIYGQSIISNLNHLDFHFGKSRKVKVYDDIFRLLKEVF